MANTAAAAGLPANSSYSAVFHRWLDTRWRPMRNASKHVARLGLTSPRAVDDWFCRGTSPSAQTLIELMAASAELAEQINKLVEDRREQRGLDALSSLGSVRLGVADYRPNPAYQYRLSASCMDARRFDW